MKKSKSFSKVEAQTLISIHNDQKGYEEERNKGKPSRINSILSLVRKHFNGIGCDIICDDSQPAWRKTAFLVFLIAFGMVLSAFALGMYAIKLQRRHHHDNWVPKKSDDY